MAKISTNAEINSIRLKEQASAPDTPASGYFQVYAKSDGKLYFKDDAGTEVAVMANPMTTAGDVMYGGASGVPTRLAAGTEGQILTMGATNPAWAGSAEGGYTQGAKVRKATNQTIPNNSATALTFDTEDYDTDTIHDNSTNPQRLTCKTAGKYMIGAHVLFLGNAGNGFRRIQLMLGATHIADARNYPDAEQAMLNVSTIYDLSVNDYITVLAYQNCGANLDVSAGTYSPIFWMQRIG